MLPYEDTLIERLRNVYYGGVPASIIVFIDEVCNGFCYDRSLLITMGMDDFQLVNGAINGLNRGNHSWAESNGWVYDTSQGVRIKKSLYYQMENPTINKINSQQDCLNFIEYQEILATDPERDKYILPLLLLMLELLIPFSRFPKYLAGEFERFKKQIDYDGLCREVHDDMVAKGIRAT